MTVSRRTALLAIAAAAAIVVVALVRIRPLVPTEVHPSAVASPTSAAAASGGATGGSGGSAGGTGSVSPASAPPIPSPLPAAFKAPSIHWPLPDLDPGLAMRGPRPTLAELSGFLYGNKPLLSVDPLAGPLDWRLSHPNPSAVTGYASDVSVAPGGSLALYLAGSDRTSRIDVFRLGVHDAQHLFTVPSVRVAPMVVPPPQLATGLDEMGWPVAYRLSIPRTWRSGVYLAKLTAAAGQSYVPFIVRPSSPVGLVVMLPTMTYQAYNSWNRASLYHWDGAPKGAPSRAYKVSFDRPSAWENGAGLLFRSELPLIIWLEDHGYSPGYIADVDLARDPAFATGARTFVVAGHAEYWTSSMRQAIIAAEGRGVGVVAFGGNLAYWQVRLEPDSKGAADRTMVCYKQASLDPLATSQPQLTTVRFDQLPTPEPPTQLFGAAYGGIVHDTLPLDLTAAVAAFAPEAGLSRGDRLEALLGGEIDVLSVPMGGVAIARTAAPAAGGGHELTATASLWIAPGGAKVFDAGTFSWSWGLDPRYAAALPGFPTERFARLTAAILAWAGTPPG